MMEIHELCGTLLRRLRDLEDVSATWKETVKSADQQLENPTVLATDAFAHTLRAQVADQTRFFDLAEAFLAAWARLSLLLFPNRGDSDTAAFRRERGEALRGVLNLGADCIFADRELRNAWMHFDERLDIAIVSGTFGDRHRFVSSARSGQFVDTTLRLLEMDTLSVRYRGRAGVVRVANLRAMRGALEDLERATQDPLAV